MAVHTEAYTHLVTDLNSKQVQLVAVSKLKPASDIQELYNLGQRHFGENYVQELCEKYELLPKDICWHFIGHLQSNKIKYIAPFVHLIHGIDSFKLLKEVDKQAAKQNRIIQCLLQVYIAQEETKFGMDAEELETLFHHPELKDLKHIRICGLMGMATLTENQDQIRKEFRHLKSVFDDINFRIKSFQLSNLPNELTMLSMGMSADYNIAIEEGSNIVRIGSLLFGSREYVK